MTKEQKQSIFELREQGLPFSQIAEAVGICRSTVKSFHRREVIRRAEEERRKRESCQFCGKRLEQKPKQKRRYYCDDNCRYAFWNRQRADPNCGTCSHICAYCGKAFSCFPSDRRKYCSRACYANARWGEVPVMETARKEKVKEKIRLTPEQKQANLDMRARKREIAREREVKKNTEVRFCLHCGKMLHQHPKAEKAALLRRPVLQRLLESQTCRAQSHAAQAHPLCLLPEGVHHPRPPQP